MKLMLGSTTHLEFSKCYNLDGFELRVLTRPAPTIDLTTLQLAVASLSFDVDAILEMRGDDPESGPIDLVKDKLLDA